MANKMETPVGEDRTTTEAVVAGGGFDSSRPPCRFFLLGKCKFGDSCSFSHQPRGRLPVCRFFEKTGSCRYGQSCKFLHGASAGGTPTPAAAAASVHEAIASLGCPSGPAPAACGAACGAACASSSAAAAAAASGAGAAGAAAVAAECGEREHKLDAGDNCGICLENIPSSGKRFGLLNCDHVYCLECLRTWRKSKGPQKDISRTCPECRKVSFFLVPSKEHLKGKAKLKAIQAYKKGLSKLPCKYHKSDNSNVCPFGARCFYAHLDASGADVKDRPTPPLPQGAPRRSCPYLRGGGARGGGRGAGNGGGGGGNGGGGGGGHRGMGHGHGHGRYGFDNLRNLYAFDFEVNMHESQGLHMNAIIRLQQLMMDAEHF